MGFKETLQKIWYFIWKDNSIWSWIVNVILAFIIVKFLIYPFFGLVLSTSHPLVAVVSSSMEHNGNFDKWWENQEKWYEFNKITKEQARSWHIHNGFNKGDIMILYGTKAKDLKVGDIIVFKSNQPDPIIHRIVKITNNNNNLIFQTKGDNNPDSIRSLGELNVTEDKIIGKAIIRIPLLGWVKIIFTGLIDIAW